MEKTLLNRHSFQDALDASPYVDIVVKVGEVMFRSDPMGLRGFFLPNCEYFPEALALTAWVVTGSENIDDFLARDHNDASTPPPRSLTVEKIQASTAQIFKKMFEKDVYIDLKTARRCLRCYHQDGLALITKTESSSAPTDDVAASSFRSKYGERRCSSSSSSSSGREFSFYK
jgi:hypothetical protein